MECIAGVMNREFPARSDLSDLESLPNELVHQAISVLSPPDSWNLALSSSTLFKVIMPFIFGFSPHSRRHELLERAAIENRPGMLAVGLYFGRPTTLRKAYSEICFQLIRQHGFDYLYGFRSTLVEFYPASTLYLALINNYSTQAIPIVRTILAQGGIGNCTSTYWRTKYRAEHHVKLVQRTPLHVVQDIEILAVLLEPNSNCRRFLNTVAYSRFTTPLAMAIAAHRPLKFVQMLLDAGASPHGPYIQDCSPSEIKRAEEALGVTENALYKGTFDDAFNHHWYANWPLDTIRLTHFELACEFGQLENVKLLLRHGVRIHDCTRAEGPLRALEGALRALDTLPQNQQSALDFVDLFVWNGLDILTGSPLGVGIQEFVSPAVFERFLHLGAWPRTEYNENGIVMTLVRFLVTKPHMSGLSYRVDKQLRQLKAEKARHLLVYAAAETIDTSGHEWAIDQARELLEWGFQLMRVQVKRRALTIQAIRDVQGLFSTDLSDIPIWQSLFLEGRERSPVVGSLSVTADITETLVGKGMPVNPDSCSRTPLHYALRIENLPFQPYLWLHLMPDVDNNVADAIERGRNAHFFQSQNITDLDFDYLMPCREKNMERIIRALVRGGVSTDARDDDGMTAESYATKNGWHHVWCNAKDEQQGADCGVESRESDKSDNA